MKPIRFVYKNHENKISTRTVIPREIKYSVNPNLHDPTWLLWAWDLEKKAERSFVLEHILNWVPSLSSTQQEVFQRHFCVTVYVADLNCQKFVFIKHKKLNKWLPPGGHVENNELPDTAAVREVKEETGLDVTLKGDLFCGPLIRPYGMQLNTIKKDLHEHIDIIYFAKTETTELKLNLEESSEICWFTINEILDPNFETFPEVKKWIERFKDEK